MKKITDFITQKMKLADVLPSVKGFDVTETLKEAGIDPGDAEFVRKFYVAKVEDSADEDRTITGMITTGAKDRDFEQMNPKGAVLTDYNKNRVVLWAHDYSSMPIGKNLWIKRKGDGLVAKTQFASNKTNPFAEQVYNGFKEGILRAFSIGFVPLKVTEHETKSDTDLRRTYDKYLLLEYSVVPVPSNPEALADNIKSIKEPIDLLLKALEIEEPEEDSTPDWPREYKMAGLTVKIEKHEGALHLAEIEGLSEKTFEEDFQKVKDIFEDANLEGEDGFPDEKQVAEKLAEAGFEEPPPEEPPEKPEGNSEEDPLPAEPPADNEEPPPGEDAPPEQSATPPEEGEQEDKGKTPDTAEDKSFECECIDCGHKMTSEDHCNTLTCPECGGTMRRAERPGPGQESAGDLETRIVELTSIVTDIQRQLASLLEDKKTIELDFDIEPTNTTEEKSPSEQLMEYLSSDRAGEVIKEALKRGAGKL